MTQIEKARLLKALHVSSNPLVLYNIWDAGGAAALTKAGAKAIGTSSWSIAAAHSFSDGEEIPLDFALMIVERIAQSTELPVTVDFEGGYAEDPAQIAVNIKRVIAAGAAGINFEDQVVNGPGLYSIQQQIDRIKAIRGVANDAGVPLFINARTDVFLKADGDTPHADLVDEAVSRHKAYAEAGADGFFTPGLTESNLICDLCDRSTLPVNVMMMGGLSGMKDVARLGVSRISFGPQPYFDSIEDLTARFAAI